jgi:hypothetical protein
VSRPTDWYVLDLDSDPTPGDPTVITGLARQVTTVAEDAEQAERDVRGLSGDAAVTTWIGAAGDVFRGALDEFPDQLHKLADSYGQAASALSWWAGELDGAQGQADRALVLGRSARARVDDLTAQLSAARAAESSASAAVTRLGSGAEPPDPAQVQSATRHAQAAAGRADSLSGSLSDVQGELDLDKRMAREAADLRESAAQRTGDRLHDASDAGIKPNSFWDDFKSAVSKVWEVTIAIAKVAVVVLGIVVLIIGGPLAWVVVGLGALILLDTLMKYANGEATLLDVGIAILGLIPGTRGLTSLGALKGAWAGGKVLGVLGHLGGSVKGLAVNGVRGAQGLWQGRRAIPVMLQQLPYTAAGRLADMAAELRHGYPGALRGFAAGFGNGNGVLGRLRTGFTGLTDGFADAMARLSATDAAYAAGKWQGGSHSYPGVDLWQNSPLPPGTRVEALHPGLSGFVVPAGTMDDLGYDAARISEAVQVGPTPPGGRYTPYRPEGISFEAVNEVPAARSIAQANPQYGAGGAQQSFIPDLGGRFQSGDIIAVTPDGSPLTSVVDDLGRVTITDSTGNVFALSNFLDARPGSGVWYSTDFAAAHEAARNVYDALRSPSLGYYLQHQATS